MTYIGANTNYKINTNTDIGANLVTVEYLIDVYPSLSDQFKTAGLWGWGGNGFAQLGDNSTVAKSSPVQTIAGGSNWKQASAGKVVNTVSSSAVKTDGTLWTWGNNSSGQLGDNSRTSRSSPVQTVSAGTNWKQTSSGGNFITAVKTDGTLWLWGLNTSGQLGDNSTTNRSSPVQTVSGGTNWKQVAAGPSHTAAVKTDGTLWLWGNNNNGQLGDNSVTNKSSPVQTVSGGTNWKQVICNNNDSFPATAAIKTDGTLWLWGNNNYNILGDGTSTRRSSPVQISGGGTNWKQVSVGATFSAAIKTDGTLWTWGQNFSGELGTGNTSARSTPGETISAGTNWSAVSAGGNFAIALKTNGTVWSWGENGSGQLGTGDITARSSPTQIVSYASNWRSIDAGENSTLAIRDDSEDPF